jgi:hypothetical protein
MKEEQIKSNQIILYNSNKQKLIDDQNLNARRDKRHGQFNRKK